MVRSPPRARRRRAGAGPRRGTPARRRSAGRLRAARARRRAAPARRPPPPGTPQRPWPTSTSTKTSIVLPAAATARASRSMPSLESTAIASRMRLASAATRASLAASMTSLRDVDVVDAGVGERFGFARLLDAHADRAGLALHPRDGRALVHLGVRPQADAVAARELRHAWRDCAPSRRGRSRAPACRSRRPGRRPAAVARQRSSRRPRAPARAAALMSPPAARSGDRRRAVVERLAVEVRGVAPADQGEALPV